MSAPRRAADIERPREEPPAGLGPFLIGNWLNLLLLFVPISIALEMVGHLETWVFATAALGIIPLAGLIGQATEELSHRVGPGIGGLLNATFGNATELIIALFALQAGLHEVVKASVSGSIIGNLLLVLGLSMVAGGWGRAKQEFNRTHAGNSAAMLFLAVVALVMPAVFDLEVFGSLVAQGPDIQELSVLVSVVLLITYAASLVFSLRTHRDLITAAPEGAEEAPRLTVREALILLFGATVVVALESEVLVGAIQATTETIGMTEFFVGIVVVAIVGNAAEHSSAVWMAVENRMELAVTIATSSSTQIALFVAPILVLASLVMGSPMTLIFNAFEVAAITLSVLAASLVTLDGESNWFEGVQLVAVYLVLVIVFYFVPA